MALSFKHTQDLRIVPVYSLKAGETVTFPLFHETATLLLKQGEQVSVEHLRALAGAGINELYECRTEDALQTLVSVTPKKQYPLPLVPVESPVFFNIYDGANRIMLRKGSILSSFQHQRLLEANIEFVYINKDDQLQTLRRYELELMKCQAEEVEKELGGQDLAVIRGNSALPNLFAKRPPMARPPASVDNMRKRYEKSVGAVDELMESFRLEKEVHMAQLKRIVGDLLEDLLSDVDLATNFTNTKENGFFNSHVTNVATLCVGVGLAFGYKERDLHDLGLAALLHETGMLGVPQEILAKKTALSPEERQKIHDHPLQALNYLKRIRGLPYRSLLAVYQEHERPDRSGYPNGRPGNLIHGFAQIISVCDAFEAMTAPRPFRQSYLPYLALEQLIYAAAKSKYAQNAMRGLLQLTGLFPVGSWIKLSNNRFAKVIGNNSEKYDRPVVAVLFDDKEKRLEFPEVLDLLHKPEMKVLDIVAGTKFSSDQTLGF
jgi:HD-GYP domain-containing protein (c-di-GMP phosphodiesterase class II)